MLLYLKVRLVCYTKRNCGELGYAHKQGRLLNGKIERIGSPKPSKKSQTETRLSASSKMLFTQLGSQLFFKKGVRMTYVAARQVFLVSYGQKEISDRL